jgi:hypothetical protein
LPAPPHELATSTSLACQPPARACDQHLTCLPAPRSELASEIAPAWPDQRRARPYLQRAWGDGRSTIRWRRKPDRSNRRRNSSGCRCRPPLVTSSISMSTHFPGCGPSSSTKTISMRSRVAPRRIARRHAEDRVCPFVVPIVKDLLQDIGIAIGRHLFAPLQCECLCSGRPAGDRGKHFLHLS